MELEDPHPLATVSEQPPTLSGLGNRRGVSPIIASVCRLVI